MSPEIYFSFALILLSMGYFYYDPQRLDRKN
jgi:hypothetical protein